MDTEMNDILDEFLETIETGVYTCAMSTKNVFSTFYKEIKKDKIKFKDNGEISFEPFHIKVSNDLKHRFFGLYSQIRAENPDEQDANKLTELVTAEYQKYCKDIKQTFTGSYLLFLGEESESMANLIDKHEKFIRGVDIEAFKTAYLPHVLFQEIALEDMEKSVRTKNRCS